ncbi:Suppressor of cytokine signaling 3, partial [Antrostomus carolinensis]
PPDPSLRLKTFSSKSEYQLVVNTVRKLQESGFYWSTVTGGEANLLLSTEPAGTFLIRDSSDQRHFFTLSVKTESGTKNLRIHGEKIPLVLSRPLSSSVSTLQHLCRKTVNGHLDSYEKMTQLPAPIKEFLDQYDAPL